MESKMKFLTKELQNMGNVAVAYSGGIDSTFLLYLSKKILEGHSVGIMNVTPLMSSECLASARRTANHIGAELIEISVVDPEIMNNAPNRCYVCKKSTFSGIISKAAEMGIENVIDGTIHEDCFSFRPGMKVLEELRIKSPLRDAGLTKKEIVSASLEMGIPRAYTETCLATRIPYNTQITAEKLKAVESSESFIKSLGIMLCRVRHHGDTARIEVLPQDMEIILSNKEIILQKLKEAGFTYISLDLEGYNSGSMDRMIMQ